VITLLRLQLVASLGLNYLLQPGKRGRKLGVLLFVLLSMAPAYTGFVVLIGRAYGFLAAHNLPFYDLVLTGMHALAQIMILFLGIPILYAALFQANDLSILLPLPLRPAHILAAKLGVAYVLELIAAAILFAPALFFHAHYARPGAVMLGSGALCLLLLPAIPLALCALLCMAVVNVPGIGRSKWVWHLGMMLGALGAAAGMMMFTNSGPQVDLLDLVQAKMQQVAQMGRWIPGSVFAMRALALPGAEGLLNLALYGAAVVGWGVLLLAAGERLYIRPVVRGSGVAARRRRRADPLHAGSFLTTYVRKELACTLKDPAVAMNAVGGYLSVPILLLMYTILKIQTKGQVDVVGQLAQAAHSPLLQRALPFVVVGIALGLSFLGTSSSLFAASYSKDGRRLWLEKTLPVPAWTLFLGKFLFGMGLVTSLNAVTVVAAARVVPLGVGEWLYILLLSEVVIAANGAIALLIDCRRPKVDWKDTVQAVKQNVNVLLAFGATTLTLLLNGMLLAATYRLGLPASTLYAQLLAINGLLLAAVLVAARSLCRGLERVSV
jgi:ABC-2 type transport system permease protein